jgi:hypothetical protein
MGWQDQTSGQTYDWSNDYNGEGVTALFDDNTGTTWWIDEALAEEWIEVEFSTPQQIQKLRARSRSTNASTQAPIGFRFKASSSGSFGGEEVTHVNVSSLSWSNNEWKEWQFSNTTAYTYWRLYMDKSSSDWIALNESEWMTLAPLEFPADILGQISTSSIDIAGGTLESSTIDEAALDDTIIATGGSQSVEIADEAAIDDTIIAAGGSQSVEIADEAAIDDTIIGQIPFDEPFTDHLALTDHAR